MIYRAFISLFILTAIISFSFVACKKDKTCKVLVIVEDSLELPVFRANVRIWCDDTENPLCIIDDTASTLIDGTARFEYPNPGILKVYVDGVAKGYVELEAGEEVVKTIKYP